MPRSTIASGSAARAVLPFKLTDGQRQSLAEIVADMQKPWPMQRLLQGDVGAGKTIVALLAALVAMENGFQVAFMAPTEILAEQHLGDAVALPGDDALSRGAAERPRHRGGAPRRCCRRSSAATSTWSSARTRSCRSRCTFRALALVVIDEQHRFGVMQRATLARQGPAPRRAGDDGDADPAHARADRVRRHGRLGDPRAAAGPQAGRARWSSPTRAATRSTTSCASRSRAGRQAYVIYPLVEESEKVDLKAATAMAEHLARDVFPDLQGRRCCTAA